MRDSRLKWGLIFLFVLWLFYGLSAYYVVQKPFSVPQLVTLLEDPATWLTLDFAWSSVFRLLLDVGTAVLINLAAWGIGTTILRFTKLKMDGLETAVFGTGLGFGALGLWVFFLGLVGGFTPTAFWGTMAIAMCLTLRQIYKQIKNLRKSAKSADNKKSPRPQRLNLPARGITFYLLIVLGLALIIALLPPTDWDGLFYHLKGPKLYLEAGRIIGGIDIPHLSFPALFEMLFTLAMGLRGDIAAKLLHFSFIPWLMALVYLISTRIFTTEATEKKETTSKNSVPSVTNNGWTAVLILISMPMVLNLGAQAYNDLPLAFYQVAALVALLRWRQQEQTGWLILNGVFAGLAMGLKYTSFVTPLILAGAVIWHIWNREKQANPQSPPTKPPRLRASALKKAIKPLLILTATTTLVALPWYLKNWAFTGNPVYPFVFGGQFWDDFRAAAYAGTGTGLGFDPIALLRLPHDLILGLNDASQDGQPGPLFLIFLPAIIIYAFSRWKRDGGVERPFNLLLIFALAQYIFWVWGVIFSAGLWQSRLLLPAFVALSPIIAWIFNDLARWDHPQFSLRRFVRLVIIMALAFNLVGQLLNWLPGVPLAYVAGSASRDEILTHWLGSHYTAMQGVNAQTPPDAVVRFLYEPRSYYCDRDCRPDSILDTFAHLEYLHNDANGIAQAWREEGISHILLFETGYEFIREQHMEWISPQNTHLMDDLAATHLQLVADWGDYQLYELK
ncbi:phospholipid carrier-dependent glycosyltransferase [Candidatus Leptofilum sp.]|uniref:phospholipid carrier-dependent glycosyltransferase n=1 Tax=Candidatus Leptofilum sp. TaxID=3241576 RepID=UPI003B5B5716